MNKLRSDSQGIKEILELFGQDVRHWHGNWTWKEVKIFYSHLIEDIKHFIRLSVGHEVGMIAFLMYASDIVDDEWACDVFRRQYYYHTREYQDDAKQVAYFMYNAFGVYSEWYNGFSEYNDYDQDEYDEDGNQIEYSIDRYDRAYCNSQLLRPKELSLH